MLDENRQPVPLAEISQVIGPTHPVPFPIALKTDAQGRFVWDQSPPEGVVVSVFKAGFLPKEVSLAVGNTESEVVLKPWSSPARTRVRGSVVAEATGSPVDAFEVLISMEKPTDSSRAIKAGADGVFVVSLPQPGGTLEVRSPGFAPAQRTVELHGEAEVWLPPTDGRALCFGLTVGWPRARRWRCPPLAGGPSSEISASPTRSRAM